jgi:preprotein translocase subunit SecF
MIDFAGKRWWYLSISLVLFLIAVVILIFPPRLKPGIEFTSGSSFTLAFTERAVSQGELRTAMGEIGRPEARIQGAGENTYLIRTSELEGAPSLTDSAGPALPGEIDRIETELAIRFGQLERKDFATVSSTVSSEIARNAAIAVAAASVAILAYIAFAFRGVAHPFRYGTAAVIALLHDAFIILGMFSLLGKVFNTEVDTAFVTAMLTIIGFSVHDTIVVFDRIREKVAHDPYLPFTEAVNASMTETLGRSLTTSLTLIFTVTAMLLLGGETIRNFLLVLLIGVAAGTYSSIGVASQVLVAWENNDIGRFIRKLRGGKAQPEAGELRPARG